jgi:hypothetical protein
VFTSIKIVLSAAIIFSTAFAPATSEAFVNAPGGAYIQCDGSKSSPGLLHGCVCGRVPLELSTW